MNSTPATSDKGYNSQHPNLAFNYNPSVPATALSCFNIQDTVLGKQNPFSLIGNKSSDCGSPFGLTFDKVSQTTRSGGGCCNPNYRDMIMHSDSTSCKKLK